jgi:DNA-binding NarL/FixJ family response regulator
VSVSDVIQVLLVDDHAIVRTGISGMLAGVPGIEIVGEAANGLEALNAVRTLAPDVVLMDLRMPVMDGPETIQAMRQQGLSPGILVLTTYDSDADILRAIEAGANGYLLKDTSQGELVQAIEATARGSSWLAPNIAATVMRQMQGQTADKLSDRELEVLRRVAKGKSNKEIASEMHISQATVKTHLIHIYRKLEVNDRTAAVTVALERGIIAI